MNTKLLKQKILDLAIRGKLTQQLKTDGTAADLLKEISSTCHSGAKRSGAIESKKLKDPEQIIPLDKSEAPFEIPPNWEWVCVDAIASLITDGEHLTPRRIESFEGYYLLSARNIQDNAIHLNDVDYVDEEEYNRISKRCNPRKDDVLISCSGSIGRVAVVKDDNKYVMVRSAAMIRPVLVHSYYLMYVLQSNCLQSQIQNYSKQTAQANLFQAAIRALQIPLPPLAEQQRIVAKIEEAFAEIDAIEKNKELLKTHIKQTRQKILDLAIHGKLVPQNKTDEPASVLLERITRDNPHYEKMTDIPFEIPESWEWVKLGDVCEPIKRGKSPKYIEQSNVLVFAQKCNQKDGPISLEKALYLDESTLSKYPEEEFLQKGDVVINSTGTGTLGRVGYFNTELPQGIKGIVPDSHVTTIRSSVVNPKYLYCFLKNKQSYLEKNGEGSTNQKELKPHTIYDLEFPLPPLAEQKRIVDKIEEIFASLNEISLHLV